MLTIEEFKKTNPYKNALLNIDEMEQKKTVLDSYPFKVFVEPTQRCDLDCIICSRSRRKSKIDMSMDLFRKVEKALFAQASEVDFFIGGEPTLAYDFQKMVDTCRNYDFLPVIFTNAQNTKEDTIRLLVALGFLINISLESVTKDIYEKIRRGARFENLIKNIEKYLYYKRQIKNPRFHLRLACTLSPLNIDEVPKIMRFAKERGIDDVFFNNCDRNVFERTFYLSTVSDKAYKILTEAKAFADENKIRFSCQKKIGNIEVEKAHNWYDFNLEIDNHVPRYLEKHNPYNGKCPHPWIQTLIRTDGTVMACCQGYLNMGRYLGGDFRRVWNNKKYQKLRSRKSYYHCGMTLGRWYCNLTRTSIWES
ncbi:MAG: radical SAM protein [Candidatus Omnitrophica bacterium]|nr:radical SAM protein [Candidatus Omnitrophota bacterium]